MGVQVVQPKDSTSDSMNKFMGIFGMFGGKKKDDEDSKEAIERRRSGQGSGSGSGSGSGYQSRAAGFKSGFNSVP